MLLGCSLATFHIYLIYLTSHLSYISNFWYISNIYLTHRSLWWRMKTQITLSCNINVMTEIFPWFLPCRQISWDFLPSRKFYIIALTQISPGFLPSRQVSGVGALTGRRRPIKLVQGHPHCFSLFSPNLNWIFFLKEIIKLVQGHRDCFSLSSKFEVNIFPKWNNRGLIWMQGSLDSLC